MLFGVELAFRQIIMDENVFPEVMDNSEEAKIENNSDFVEEESFKVLFGFIITMGSLRFIIYFTGALCIGVSLALGGLTLWHMRLITLGETSIEYHLNKSERKKSSQVMLEFKFTNLLIIN